MKCRKYLAFGCIAVMTAVMMAGCTSSNTASDTAEEVSEKEEATIVQVTAIDGTSITADVGEISSQEMGGGRSGDAEAPDNTGEMPQGAEAPDNTGEIPQGAEAPDNTGEMPQGADAPDNTGEMPEDGETPPEKPSGDGIEEDGKASGNAGERQGKAGGFGGTFTATGDSITFTITDDTSITVQSGKESQEGTADDIAVGSILEIELNENSEALSIVVRSMNTQDSNFGGSTEVVNGTAATTVSENTSIQGETYASSGDDENALRIDGVEVTLSGITVEKTGGDSSNTENGDFYGQNAALLALNGANVTIEDANVTTSAVNGNGVFSYGEGTTVTISDSVIRTTENNSGGIQTTGGGTTNAYRLDIETQGSSSAAIRSDRGGGTVNVEGGTYVTNGTGSPAVYSTADISVTDADLTANASEGIVVEGKNSVSLVNCDVTGNMKNTYQGDSDENIHCIMIYQSMSGDADVGEAAFSAEGGTITSQTGDLFYITNTDCQISLDSVSLSLANDVFLRVEGNSSSRGWGTEGSNGGNVVLNTEAMTIEGNLLVDDISSLDFTMGDGTNLTGQINSDHTEGTVDIVMEDGSSWTLTGDSYITSFEGDTGNIVTNGYHLYVDGEQVL